MYNIMAVYTDTALKLSTLPLATLAGQLCRRSFLLLNLKLQTSYLRYWYQLRVHVTIVRLVGHTDTKCSY